MTSEPMSYCFNTNFSFLKIFALWPGRKSKPSYYKYYTFIFLFINLIIYNILLTINLLYTPRRVDLLIREVIFNFTEVAVMFKVFMIIVMRKEIIEALDILDCEAFKGENEQMETIIAEHVSQFKSFWKMIVFLSNFCYSSLVFLPILLYYVSADASMGLPICKYYFLPDDIVQRYFVVWFIYQSFGMYSHMTYNVNIDTLIVGFILMAIAQVKILNIEFRNLKIDKKSNWTLKNDEMEIEKQFHKYLERHRILLSYCAKIQEIIDIAMFIQFGMASIIICVVLCGLTLPSSSEMLMFMICYLAAMVLQIFVPAWLGTQLRYETQELVFAAYSSSWISRPEKYKTTLKLFMLRSNIVVKFTGWKMFPLSLDTFFTIIKTAYSFFTLVRNVQDRQIQ